MFIAPDGTLWIQLLNFAIFFVLLNIVFLRPVGQAIKKRREYINSVTTDYEKYQAEANALRQQAEDVRASARRDAEATLGKARADASNEAARLATDYGSQVQNSVESAQKTVAAEVDAARANEAAVVSQLADLMVQRTVVEAAK